MVRREVQEQLMSTVRGAVEVAFQAATALRAVSEPQSFPQATVVLSQVVHHLDRVAQGLEDKGHPDLAERAAKCKRELEQLVEKWRDEGVDV